MINDLVSIIIPVYNVEIYLSECIKSVINQTHKNIEIILVNDGSKDSSGEICNRFAEENSLITVIHKKNGGLSSARNQGLDWLDKNSKSNWVCFVDSDDWLHPNYIEFLLEAAIQYSSPISVCYYNETADRSFAFNNCKKKIELWSSEDAYTLKKNGPCAYAWNKLYQRKCFQNVRFPEGKYWEDLFVTYKLLLPLKNIPVVRNELYYYYINPHGIVRSEWSEKNLDCIEAFANLIQYLSDKEDTGFFRKMLKSYVFVLVTNRDKAKEMTKKGITEKDCSKVINKYIIRMMTQYWRHLTLDEYAGLCKSLFPRIYVILRKTINRINLKK